MSQAVPMLLLNALLDDFSMIRGPGAGSGAGRAGGAPRVAEPISPAVGRRVVAAEAWADALTDPSDAVPGLPLMIHGPAARAMAGYRTAAAAWPAVGIDIAQERDRHCGESVHRSLAHLTQLPRSVPVTVGLALEPGWRDGLSMISARGRSVRFAVCGVDAPDAPVLVEAIRAAVAERCSFSWSCGLWGAVTDSWDAQLPGILNVLLATAVAVRGGGGAEIGAQLARTDRVEIVDDVTELDDATARQIRALLDGFAVPRVAPVVDALRDLDLLPKAVREPWDGLAVR
ncbi:MAG TPA: hypothetical protein VFU65_22335 [Actinocrinis sp.]|nr:hypothetical protein [Actinocrinis sp.]